MSTTQREWFSRWMPLLVAIATNGILVAYGYGKLEQKLAPLEAHVFTDTTERAMALFVTRQEFGQRNDTRDRELADVKASLREINAKIDRLLESRE
jgi:hypothetical protein